ncbi:MAG: DsbE family thiol:disulfide interchange protein [Pseudomonadota bacterium]
MSAAPEPAASAQKSGFRPWMFIPLLTALLMLSTFLLGLGRDNVRDLPSALIDKPVPEFALSPLMPDAPGLSTEDLKTSGVKLVNIWASWCGPCRAEHPFLNGLAKQGITVHGINYKDQPDNARAFLAELGDPYTLIGADQSGRAGIEWGVYGVPETFVIDGAGRVVYKHIGPINPGDVTGKILPAIETAAARAAGAE